MPVATGIHNCHETAIHSQLPSSPNRDAEDSANYKDKAKFCHQHHGCVVTEQNYYHKGNLTGENTIQQKYRKLTEKSYRIRSQQGKGFHWHSQKSWRVKDVSCVTTKASVGANWWTVPQVPSPWRCDSQYTFYCCHLGLTDYEQHDVIHKTGITKYTTTLPEEGQAMFSGNTSHILHVVSKTCEQLDMQTHRRADCNTPTMAEVTTTAIQPQPQTMPCRCNQSTSYTSILLRWLTWKSFVSTHFNYYTRHRDTVSIKCI